jgi:hypothetical protein
MEDTEKTLETTTQLINNNQFNWEIMNIVYMITIIICMVILLISLIQFTYCLLNMWTPWYKFHYKKPTILLAIWLLLTPIVFIIETLINLL